MEKSDLETLDGLCAKIATEGREYWWIKPEVNEVFEKNGLAVDPDHFYAPTPSRKDVEAFDFNTQSFPLDKLSMNWKAWEKFLKKMGKFGPEFMDLRHPGFDGEKYPIVNVFCANADALALYTAVRKFKPKRVVEIGSGFSTHVALSAVRQNGSGQVACIEPYPTETLLKIKDDIDIRQQFVQDVELDYFSSLEPGDILFIDSSHISAFQSDVNYEFFNILPVIKPGVIVHVHDIFLPFEYPSYWVKDLRWRWNEQYLLYALLLQNPHWSVFMPTFYSWSTQMETMTRLTGIDADILQGGASFWMQRQG